MARIWIAISVFVGLAIPFAGLAYGEVHGQTTYHVIGVSANDPDGLNVRDNVIEAQSLRDTTIIGSLAWNARGIVSSGLVVEIGRSTWREIRHGNLVGWVNEKFLSPDANSALAEVTPEKLKCSGTEPFWSLDMAGAVPTYTGTDSESGEWLENEKLQRLATFSIVKSGPENWSTTMKFNSTGRNLTAVINKASPMCSDGMSNLLFPYEVIMLKGAVPRPVYGCCKIDIERQ